MELVELMVYKKAYELSNKIWEIVIMLDNFEKNTIGRQLSRSADSISANIAEGYGRFSYKENKQFCFYARGSLFETKDWLNKLENRKIISRENC